MTTHDSLDENGKDINGLKEDRVAPKSSSPVVVAGLYAQRVVDTAREMGVKLSQLATATGFAEATLAKLPEEMPGSSYQALMQAAANLSGESHFGLRVGERISPASYPVLGYTLMSCRDLGHALQQVIRYEHIIHNLGSFSMVVLDGKLRLRWTHQLEQRDPVRHVTESVMVGVQVFAERLVGKSIELERITFAHPAPESLSEMTHHFGGVPLFDAPHNEVICDAEILTWPIVGADESLFPVLKQHAERLLVLRVEELGVVDDVRRALNDTLSSGNVKLRHVAKILAVHPRTLQRRLQEAGTSFQEILDGLRLDLAKHYLAASQVSLGEVAFLLGYHDQSSFNRCFKQWVGKSPSAFRADSNSFSR